MFPIVYRLLTTRSRRRCAARRQGSAYTAMPVSRAAILRTTPAEMSRNDHERGGRLRGGQKLLVFLIERLDGLLNDVDFPALEERLATLHADPGRNGVPVEMITAAIDRERCGSLHETTLAMKALHQRFLWRESGDQSAGSGTYTVMTAK